MKDLESHGEEKIRKILVRHGVKEPFFGVKVEFLKTIQKKVKTDYQLAKDLFATGNADAMYLAGLIADDAKMTRKDLQDWVQRAVSQNISEYTVPWVAAGSPLGFELAKEWIESPVEHVAATGWTTLGHWVSLKPDDQLDLPYLRSLLKRVAQKMPGAPDRVRYAMNGFVIAAGAYVLPLTQEALSISKQVGAVTVNSHETAGRVPDAASHILKIKDKGQLGKKKKMVKC